MIRQVGNFFFSVLDRNSIPVLLFLVTQRCNAKCDICYLKSDNITKDNELNYEEIKKMSSSIKKVYKIILSGGEPFLREDIADIGDYLIKNNHISQLDLTTNGYYSDNIAKNISKLAKMNRNTLMNISVSIDGIGKRHDEIRGIDLFDKAVSTIKSLIQIGKEYNNLNTGVLVTIQKQNKDEIISVLEYLNNMDINFVDICIERNKEMNQCNSSVSSSYHIAQDYLNENANSRMKGMLSNVTSRMVNKARRNLIKNIISKQKRNFHCYAGKYFFMIDAIGNVYCCDNYQTQIGDLRGSNYNLSGIIQSAKCREMTRKVNADRCVCTFECIMPINIIMNPRMYSKLLI